MTLLIAGITTFCLSFFFTWIQIKLSDRIKTLQYGPRSDRWHTKATPTMGGISFVLAIWLVTATSSGVDAMDWRLLILSTAMFGLGLLDDLYRFKPYVKLAGQIMIVSIAVYLGIHGEITMKAWIYIPLSMFWLLMMTNAFNLLDNMDGLASGVALISALFLSLYQGSTVGHLLPFIFATALFGFLIWNWKPAKIFMGDCGSHFLGFFIAALAILNTWQSASNLFVMLLTPVLILSVPIFDTLLVSILRKSHGLPISMGGRDHSSHRLVALGLSEKKAVSIFFLICTICGCIGIASQYMDKPTWGILASLVFLSILGFSLALNGAKVYDVVAPNQRNLSENKPLPTMLFFKRRMIEVVADTVLIGLSYSLAYMLRYDWSLSPFLQHQLQETLPFVIVTKLLMFLLTGLYEGNWTYINLKTSLRVIRSNIFATAAMLVVLLLRFRFSGFSRTLFIIDFLLLLSLMVALRGVWLWIREKAYAKRKNSYQVLVIGTQNRISYLSHEILKNPSWRLEVFGSIALPEDYSISPQIFDEVKEYLRKKTIDQIICIHDQQTVSIDALSAMCDDYNVHFTFLTPLGHSVLRGLSLVHET